MAKSKPARSWAVVVFATLPLATAQLHAQLPEESPPPAAVFQERIDVRVINVEVVVTDRRGRRIEGLRPEDFLVKVDGVETPIDFFTEISGGHASVSVVAAGASESGTAPIAEGEPVTTRYLVFIDNLFSLENHRNDVLDALEADLVEMGPNDWMAIVAFDGRRLDLLCNWGTRPQPLKKAFEEARSAGSFGLHRLAEVKQVDDWRDFEREHMAMLETLLRVPTGGPFAESNDDESDAAANASQNLKTMRLDRAGGVEVDYAYRVRSQVRTVALAAAATMRGFSAAEGRKAMLLLSGGWPTTSPRRTAQTIAPR